MNNGMGNVKRKNCQKENKVKEKEVKMSEKILPLGSIIYLKEGTAKLMVVGRGASFDNGEGQTFSDYIGVVYPNGIDPQDALFFNNEDIDQIVFEGFTDEEEERYVRVYEEWKEDLDKEKKSQTDETIGF